MSINHLFPPLRFVAAGLELLPVARMLSNCVCRSAALRPSITPCPLPPDKTTFLGSAFPTTGISVASHCWNGFATNSPFEVNHLVNGVDMVMSLYDDGDEAGAYRTFRLYMGVCFWILDEISNYIYQNSSVSNLRSSGA